MSEELLELYQGIDILGLVQLAIVALLLALRVIIIDTPNYINFARPFFLFKVASTTYKHDTCTAKYP